MANKNNFKKSDIILGKNIERLRISKDLSRKDLSGTLKLTLQQIQKYECGRDLVPLPMLEKIAIALGEPIVKKIIRRISVVRKLEVERNTQMVDELIDLYNQAIPNE